MILHGWRIGIWGNALAVWWIDGASMVEVLRCNNDMIELWSPVRQIVILCYREHCKYDFDSQLALLVGHAL